jgi:hypothetical protein
MDALSRKLLRSRFCKPSLVDRCVLCSINTLSMLSFLLTSAAENPKLRNIAGDSRHDSGSSAGPQRHSYGPLSYLRTASLRSSFDRWHIDQTGA